MSEGEQEPFLLNFFYFDEKWEEKKVQAVKAFCPIATVVIDLSKSFVSRRVERWALSAWALTDSAETARFSVVRRRSVFTLKSLTMTDSNQAPATTKPEDRSDLLAKARSFLASPQVRNQDVNAKRAFLVEKGLNDTEIAELLQTIVCVYFIFTYTIAYNNILPISLHNCHLFLREPIPSHLLQLCLLFFLA